VCGALQEAHEKGIVHRDLKPENIFLCRNGGLQDFPKVLDFGLAKITETEMRPGSIQLTQEGMVFGTPEFMSPEQAQGKILDHRSDIYSLAIILYEALTTKLPFRAQTPMDYLQKHVLEAPIPLDSRVPNLLFPPGLSQVIERALAKQKEARFGSALEFAEALRPYAEMYNQRLPSQPPSQRTSVPTAPPALAPHSLPQPPPQRRMLELILVAAVFLLMGVALTAVTLRYVVR
jgi:serine/threonine-protein kinase